MKICLGEGGWVGTGTNKTGSGTGSLRKSQNRNRNPYFIMLRTGLELEPHLMNDKWTWTLKTGTKIKNYLSQIDTIYVHFIVKSRTNVYKKDYRYFQ